MMVPDVRGAARARPQQLDEANLRIHPDSGPCRAIYSSWTTLTTGMFVTPGVHRLGEPKMDSETLGHESFALPELDYSEPPAGGDGRAEGAFVPELKRLLHGSRLGKCCTCRFDWSQARDDRSGCRSRQNGD